MRNFARQEGISMGGMLIVLVLIGLAALVAIRLVPVYMESFSVQKSVMSVVEEAQRTPHTPLQMRDLILKRLSINNVERITRDNIMITREGFFYKITVDYEVRTPFIKNIDFVVTFENHGEVPAR
jgi:hypothetical protein